MQAPCLPSTLPPALLSTRIPTRAPVLVLALTLVLPLFASRWATAAAQPSTDLSGGVFIVHRPSGLVYSLDEDPPPGGWCAAGQIADCESQENDYRPSDGNVDIWFVLAAFPQESEWCGVEFGVDYADVEVAELSMCVPSSALETPSDFWPESGSGTTLITVDVPWTGTFNVVYYFFGYAYSSGTFALTENVLTPGQTAFFNRFEEEFPADCYGAIGFGVPGVDCCPAPAASVPEPAFEPPERGDALNWGTIKAIYRQSDR
jgi:hypothetical protein